MILPIWTQFKLPILTINNLFKEFRMQVQKKLHKMPIIQKLNMSSPSNNRVNISVKNFEINIDPMHFISCGNNIFAHGQINFIPFKNFFRDFNSRRKVRTITILWRADNHKMSKQIRSNGWRKLIQKSFFNVFRVCKS